MRRNPRDKKDPFRLKFILKTKDVFKLSGADYFLKLGDSSRLEKMKPLDGEQLMNEVQEIDKDACGDYCVATTKNGAKLIKMLSFDQFYRHIVFDKTENGYLEKRIEQTIPVSVFYYLG